MADLKNIIEEIKTLTITELNDLVKMVEEEFGVSASAPVMMAGAPAAAAAAEEKSEFTVVLKEAGAQTIKVIQAVREITGLGLLESKALVVNVPSNIKENVSADEAKSIEAKLKEAGATVELK